jgi:hypothetical protein
MSMHDRVCGTVSPDGQEVMIVEGPSEIASWFFPREPDEDEQRIAVKTVIEELLDKRIAEALAKSPDENDRK